MSEPSLSPTPSLLPASFPFLSAWLERPGPSWAAMDRYSMEELIQLGQGRALGRGYGHGSG